MDGKSLVRWLSSFVSQPRVILLATDKYPTVAICRRFVSELRTGREGGLEWVDEWRVRNLVSVSRRM